MIEFESEERLSLIDRLEEHGVFIKALWSLSALYFTDKIDTAAVQLKDDCIYMMFNKQFWESLPPRAQMFVVCHEQLHIMSDHFERLQFGQGDAQNKNRAADVSINHSLVRNYDFEKEDMPNWERYCWVETVFPDQTISENESAEYYYAMIQQRLDRGQDVGGETIDDHTPGNQTTPDRPSEKLKEAISEGQKEVKDKLDNQIGVKPPTDFEPIIDKISTQGSSEQTHEVEQQQSPTWLKLYNRIPKSVYDRRIGSHWIRRERNHMLLPSSLEMPGDHEEDEQAKIHIRVYLDTSGSCIEHAKYFLTSALTLPPNKFEVTLYGFCADVYELPKHPPYKLSGFGAESFQAVENHVESQKTTDAVMVFTDGYSAQITHANPKKWHWFITPNGTETFLDPRVNHYKLEDYGWMGK